MRTCISFSDDSLNFKVQACLGLIIPSFSIAIRPMMGLSFGVVIFLSIIFSIIRLFELLAYLSLSFPYRCSIALVLTHVLFTNLEFSSCSYNYLCHYCYFLWNFTYQR